MAYYFAIYDDYYGIKDQHESSSMKNALAGLRRLLRNTTGAEAGIITTVRMQHGNHYTSGRNPKGYVGTMNVRARMRATDDYVWFAKGKRKGQSVMSDGTLRAISKKRVF